MPFDRALGRPLRPLLRPGFVILPVAIIGLVGARFLPGTYHDWVWGASFVLFAACLVLFTPYLMLAGLCFYALAQLPFPKTLAFAAWSTHALLLLAVAVCLWRTWVLWPADLTKRKPLPTGAKPAPWWGYVLGGILIVGIYGVMAYFLHFQDE